MRIKTLEKIHELLKQEVFNLKEEFDDICETLRKADPDGMSWRSDCTDPYLNKLHADKDKVFVKLREVEDALRDFESADF